MALCRGGATPGAGRRLGWAWELRWGEVKPFPRLFWAGRGRNDELDGELRTAAMLCRGGGVPEGWGGDGGVGKHLWKVEKLAVCMDLEEMGRRRRSAAS